MALSRSRKTENVTKLAADLETSTSAIIGTFTALTAAKDVSLRKTVRDAGGKYHVVKNKLAARAGQGTRIEAALQGLKGVSSVAYTSGDPVALAKALSAWVKDNSEFTFKLGIVDGKVINIQEIGDLATMPGKEELFSKLLFLINSPAQRLATVINATGRDLAVVINQAVEKEKFSAPEGSAMADPVGASLASEGQLVAEAHVTESPVPSESTPEQQIAENPASEADPVQPENGTASQAGEAATSDPVEG